MKFTFTNLSFIILLLFISGSYSQSISLYTTLQISNNGTGFIRSNGYFGQNPYQLNITIGDYYYQRAINITYINSDYFEGYAPLGFIGYQDVRIYNTSNRDLLYYGVNNSYYYYDPQPTPTPSSQQIYIDYFTVRSNFAFITVYGYFGQNPNHLNITVGSLYDQRAIHITYIDSYYMQGYAPLGFVGYQDVRIYNVTSNQLLYFGYQMAYYYQETPTPSNQPIEITSNLYIDNNGNGFINGTGYFGQKPYQLNITIGDYYYQRAINITYIDSYSFEGYAPLGYYGNQDIRIYNVTFNELLYTAYDKVFYYYSTGSSSSSSPTETPTSTPSVTPTASPSTPVIQCKYSSNGFYINSTESIQCHGTGPSYCETNSGSTCSTESNNSTIKCTTGSGSSSFYCIGNNIKCKSSYVTCSIEKPQSSYLLVNGIEQKSNYYDHSQPNNNINNNNQDNSSSASMIYSSLSLLGLLISSILIIV